MLYTNHLLAPVRAIYRPGLRFSTFSVHTLVSHMKYSILKFNFILFEKYNERSFIFIFAVCILCETLPMHKIKLIAVFHAGGLFPDGRFFPFFTPAAPPLRSFAFRFSGVQILFWFLTETFHNLSKRGTSGC